MQSSWLRLQSHPDPALRRLWNVMQLAVLGMPLNILIGGVTILVCSLVVWRRRANVMVQTFVNQGLLLLGSWMVIIALFAQRRDYSLPGLFNFLPFFVVFVAQARLIRTPQQMRRLAWLLVLPMVPVAIMGLGQLFLRWRFHWQVLNFGDSDGILLDWALVRYGRPEGRMSSLFYYATILASYLTMTFTLGLGLWVDAWREKHRWIRKVGLGAIVLLNAVALFLTNSRNAWGIALAVVVAYSVYIGWRFIAWITLAVVAAVLGSAYGPVSPVQEGLRSIVPRIIWARINDDLFLNRPPASLRVNQWKFAWNLICQRPLTGWGLRNFTPLYKDATQFYIGHPHNLPLMLSAEMGVPATLIFYSLIGWIVYRGVVWLRSAAGRDRFMMFSYVLTFMACTVFSLFDVTLFDARVNVMGWLVLAAIWGVGQTVATSFGTVTPIVAEKEI
jgi:O-antigen ligase